ncbi:hypothetical protein [Symbioplanes lichenis]|uniref:hypothetical protein n=1 Tax=Symbioplanes lichenis TaxID=1629072 RepID=UPI0027388807|nr:hypothetical protein [Actinoplanes lichenis]
MTSAVDPGDGTVVGVTLGHPDTATAEHWLASLDPAPIHACTHLVSSPRPHVAWSLEFSGIVPAALGDSSASAAAAHGVSGRAVIYPGVDKLVGDLTVASVLALSAIDAIEVLGGGPADRDTTLQTNNFVRPVWRDGRLILTVMPAAGGKLVPFENRHPTPCCADHA